MEGSDLNKQLDQSMTGDVKKAKVEDLRMEHQDVTIYLHGISNELDKQRRIHKSNEMNNETLSNTARAMIGKQREEIKNFFDKLEHEINIKVDAIKVENQQRQDSVIRKLERLQDNLQNLMSDTENKEKYEPKFKEDIKALEENLANLRSENQIINYKYQQPKQINEILVTVKELGMIEQTGPESSTQSLMMHQEEKGQDAAVEANQVVNSDYTEIKSNENEKPEIKLERSVAIHARSKEDRKQSTITGLCTMPDGFIAVVDFGNSSVKMIDTKENKIVSALAMQGDPHDITKVADDLVAVTLFYKRQIQFFSVNQSKSLSMTGFIETDSPCYGVIHSNNKLAVTQTKKLEILDKKGKVLQTFASDSAGNQLFSHAKYLTMSPDLSTIYVSDHIKNTVIGLSTDGKVKAKYKDSELQMPYGLAVDSVGSVYVCGYNSNTIHKMSADLSSGRVLLDESDGIGMPQSIAYCARQNRLYVGMWCNDTIRVYQL